MLLYSLTPCLHQALYVKGMVYIVILVTWLQGMWLPGSCRCWQAGGSLVCAGGLACCLELRRLLLPPAQPGPWEGSQETCVCGGVCVHCASFAAVPVPALQEQPA